MTNNNNGRSEEKIGGLQLQVVSLKSKTHLSSSMWVG